MPARLRPFQDTDLETLKMIYREAIQGPGMDHYSPEQIRAWSSFADEETGFREWIDNSRTLIAVVDDQMPVGFAGLESNGRIASLFVHPTYMRRGIATHLLQTLIEEAQLAGEKRLTTDASRLSRPVFERSGFTVIEVEITHFKGVTFDRYVMERVLQAPS